MDPRQHQQQYHPHPELIGAYQLARDLLANGWKRVSITPPPQSLQKPTYATIEHAQFFTHVLQWKKQTGACIGYEIWWRHTPRNPTAPRPTALRADAGTTS
jgi:hypothetical protein